MRFPKSAGQSLKRLIRVALGEEIWESGLYRCETLCLGNAGANWCVCPTSITNESTVYSVGVGTDISFDLELIRRFRVRVDAFDPTPKSIAWLSAQRLPREFIFHPYGVAGVDGICKFSPPRDPNHVSHTTLKRDGTGPILDLRVARLCTIMGMLEHSRIHILKMDIEGAEYEVIGDMLSTGIRPYQLLVEFHHRWSEIGIERTRQAVLALKQSGYKIFHISRSGEEYSFLHPANVSSVNDS